MQNRKRRRNLRMYPLLREKKKRIFNDFFFAVDSTNKKSSLQHPIIIEPIHGPTTLFSYPEQALQSSFSKIAEIQKLDQFKDKPSSRLIVTTNGNFSSSVSGSSDPILSNPNSSSLSGSDQLTVTDFYPLSTATNTNPTDSSYKSYTNPIELPISSAQNDLLWSQSQYGSYGFPFYTTSTTNNHLHEIVSNRITKEDSAESGYSTPSKTHHQSKKTVYEVVV